MAETKNLIPKRRFKEFQNTEAWEQCKLGETLSLLKDGTHGTHENVDKGVYLLSAKNIKNGRIVIDDTTDRVISIEEYNKIHSTFNLKKGDVLLTIVGSIGEVAILENAENITFQRSVAYLRPSNNLDSQFLLTNMQTSKFQNELKNRQVVSAQPGIYLGSLEVIPFSLPEITEQKKIGNFFENLDNLITLHQRKLEKIKSMKKAYLYEMFPAEGECRPKRRFKGFTDDWEQSKLGELAQIKDSARVPNALWRREGVPYLRSSNLDSATNEFLYISQDDYEMYKSKTGAPELGDVLFNSGGNIGTAILKSDEKPVYVQGGAVLYVKTSVSKNIDGMYLKYYFETLKIKKYIVESCVGGTIKHFTLVPANAMPIAYPKTDEQKEIGYLFEELDNLITLHQHKLDKLKNLKKAYLNEMFV